LVKEFRLQGISTSDAANAFMPSFVADYNRRFAKLPRDRYDAHRTLRDDEDLDLIFTHREPRKVSQNLTVNYGRKLYLITDTPQHRRYAGKYLEVYHYPDDRIELRAAGISMPYSLYDKLGDIDQGEIVENKRLGSVLRVVQLVQAQRDNRYVAGPSTAHRVDGKKVPRRKTAGTKTQRQLNADDLRRAVTTGTAG
jgi:hypothetical protein